MARITRNLISSFLLRSRHIGLFLTSALALQLTLNLPAQQCTGGSADLLYQFDGISSGDYFGGVPFGGTGWSDGSVLGTADINADGYSDIIVGASQADPNGLTNSGSVYVYSGATGFPLLQLDGHAAGDGFGCSVASAGDMDGDGVAEIIVGAWTADYGGVVDAGSAYVYSGATGALLRQFHGADSRGEFGCSVASAGDIDGDGFDDVIIGARRETGGGRVSVFSGASGALLYLFDGPDGDFGSSVAGAGDVDADGFDDLIIGARFAGPWRYDGSVFVISGGSGIPIYEFHAQRPNDYYGQSVAGAGDVDGDGVGDIIMGAFFGEYVDVVSGATGSPIYRVENPQSGIGVSLSGAGDIDGDGYDDFIIGGRDPSISSPPGSAYVVSGATGSLLQRFDGQNGDELSAVHGGGDVNGDGRPDVIIGAGGTMNDTGSVYVYSVDSFMTVDTSNISASVGGRVDFFLDFPDSEAGEQYLLLGSLSGSGAWTVRGGCIPLIKDPFTQVMISSPPPYFFQATGTLGAGGTAQAWVDAPAGALAGIVGSSAWFSAVVFDPIFGLHYASVAIPIEVLP